MNFTPYISAKDLSEMLGLSNRSARRLMAKIVEKRPQVKWAEDDILWKGRNKCLAHYEALRYTPLKRAAILSHFERVLNEVPSMRWREAQKVVKAGEKWHERVMLFENNLQETVAVKRYVYSYISSPDEDGWPGVFGFGYTLFPSFLFCEETDLGYGLLLKDSTFFKSLERVFYDVALNEELLGYLERFCGRKKRANSIVVVEEMEGLSEAAFHQMVAALGQKLDRKRCLVFLPEAMVPESLRNLERIRGFRKLEGSGFYLGGGIGKWVDVRFWLRFEF